MVSLGHNVGDVQNLAVGKKDGHHSLSMKGTHGHKICFTISDYVLLGVRTDRKGYYTTTPIKGSIEYIDHKWDIYH